MTLVAWTLDQSEDAMNSFKCMRSEDMKVKTKVCSAYLSLSVGNYNVSTVKQFRNNIGLFALNLLKYNEHSKLFTTY